MKVLCRSAWICWMYDKLAHNIGVPISEGETTCFAELWFPSWKREMNDAINWRTVVLLFEIWMFPDFVKTERKAKTSSPVASGGGMIPHLLSKAPKMQSQSSVDTDDMSVDSSSAHETDQPDQREPHKLFPQTSSDNTPSRNLKCHCFQDLSVQSLIRKLCLLGQRGMLFLLQRRRAWQNRDYTVEGQRETGGHGFSTASDVEQYSNAQFSAKLVDSKRSRFFFNLIEILKFRFGWICWCLRSRCSCFYFRLLCTKMLGSTSRSSVCLQIRVHIQCCGFFACPRSTHPTEVRQPLDVHHHLPTRGNSASENIAATQHRHCAQLQRRWTDESRTFARSNHVRHHQQPTAFWRRAQNTRRSPSHFSEPIQHAHDEPQHPPRHLRRTGQRVRDHPLQQRRRHYSGLVERLRCVSVSPHKRLRGLLRQL